MISAWNWLDWALAAIIAISVLAAIRKGFVRELISLAALVAGVVVASLGYPRASVWFEDLAKSHEVALGLGFLALFLAVLLAGAVISLVAWKLVKTAGLEWFDRFLGGIFGLIRGALVDCVILLALIAFAIKPQAVRQSNLAPYITAGARVIAWVLPASLKGQFSEGFQKFKEALAQTDRKATRP
ncbi:MAG TPA: CvpA family protein [Terriglobia bacterium]|jgi:membrane protein required for colicin V production|nr:CvpA family protein [Terriglobia bacterium]